MIHVADKLHGEGQYDAVVFDLLTALIDSWTLWNSIAGSSEAGMRWRLEYLKLTYGSGAYRDYETIVGEAAQAAGLLDHHANELRLRWQELTAWPEAGSILTSLAARAKLAVVTNCSTELGHAAAERTFSRFDVVITAEDAGYYKPRAEPYAMALRALGSSAGRTLFVAGSASDVPGASAVGMPVYWHNRIGLSAHNQVVPSYMERSLDRLANLI